METIQYMKMCQQLHGVYVNTYHIYEVNDYMVGTSQSGLIDFRKKVSQLHEVYYNMVEIIQYMKMCQQLYRVYVNTCHIYEVNDYMVRT